MEPKIKPSPTYKAELLAAQNKASKPLLRVGIFSIINSCWYDQEPILTPTISVWK